MTQRWSKQALEQSDVVPGQHLTAPGTGSWMVWRHPFTTDTAGLSVAMARKLLVMRWCILSVNMNCTSSEWRSTKKRWKNGCIHTSTRRSFKDLHLSRKQLRHRKEITWAAITENISLHCFYLCKTRVGQFDRLSKEETNVVAGEREREIADFVAMHKLSILSTSWAIRIFVSRSQWWIAWGFRWVCQLRKKKKIGPPPPPPQLLIDTPQPTALFDRRRSPETVCCPQHRWIDRILAQDWPKLFCKSAQNHQ